VVEDGTFDLLHGDFTVIVGINLIEDLLDLSFPALWEFEVVFSGESSDGISDFFHGEALVSVGVNFLEHLIEWHRLFDLKGNKGCLWDVSPPGSGSSGDEGSNGEGEFHLCLKFCANKGVLPQAQRHM